MARRQKQKFSKDAICMGFDAETVQVRLDDIMPLKIVSQALRDSEKYKQIVCSIREIGIIEPPMLAPKKRGQEKYLLLDGHLRIEALKEFGKEEVTCLISTDDESYTYNKHISRITTIQEHRMILRAIKRGVSETKIAKALNVDVDNIISKRDLLNGICPEVVDLLKDKMVPSHVFPILKRMKAVRQFEVATLMTDANTYSVSTARMMLAATLNSQLVNPAKPKKIKGLNAEQMARMEAEMASLQGEYKLIQESYGPNNLTLTIAKTYLAGLLANARVERYLKQHHGEILTQFRKIADMKSLTSEDAA